MCGLCGQIDPRGVEPRLIQRMTDVLRHRGPDGEGFYCDGTVALGHRRLAVIDLSGGRQPMRNENGTLWIVFNGEIYNYREVRAGLRQRHRFTTHSDTEVILHLYEEIGERCVERLRGQFAFAIWDARDQSLFLARDHLGQKPMFYVHTGETFAFASEIKALLEMDPALRVMSPQALHQYLTLRLIAPPHTMFEYVRKLPPGHRLRFRDGRVTIDRYWTLGYEPKHTLGEADLLDELDQRMQAAVRYHMVSDVPVGAFLSGGLDSSLIVAMMSRMAEQPIQTFSGGIPFGKTSELPFARLVAEQFGTDHHEETFNPSLINILPELCWHLDEPSDPLAAPTYLLAQMARRHVKVVLDGSGGDELFGGYDRYYGNLYVDAYARLPLGLRRDVVGTMLRFVPDGFWYKSLSHKLKWLNQLSYVEGGRRYSRSLSYFYFSDGLRESVYGEALRPALNGFDPEEAIYACYDAGNAVELLDKMLFADSMVRLPDHPVMILDRTSMAHGLEARSPYMDHELVEFAARIPAALKVRGRTRRYIQTRLAERYLPPEIVHRQKQGFSSGLPYLLADEFRRLFALFLDNSELVQDGYLRGPGLQRLLGDHLTRRIDQGNRLWLLCNAEIWYRLAIKGWSRDRLRAALETSQIPAG
jgi:asparagine synthase (glutamine-hydrolysing)